MRLFNFGSLNIDHVYNVDEFVKPGQTIHARHYQQFCGGKGLNQSIAAARAGMQVLHVGQIGAGGEVLTRQLDNAQVDTSLVDQVDAATGHAIIQVAASGENEIIVFGGANQSLTRNKIDAALATARSDDWVLCQNEINQVDYLLDKSAQAGLLVAFNPAPMTDLVKAYPLHTVDLLIVNQTEGAALTGQTEAAAIAVGLSQHYPDTRIVLTLGAQGAMYVDQQQTISVAAEPLDAIDTTAAGDTFIGYFLSELADQKTIDTCLQTACRAAALCVQKAGASDSIPLRSALN